MWRSPSRRFHLLCPPQVPELQLLRPPRNSNLQCPVWKREKEICSVKATTGVSYQQARRTVEEKMPNTSTKTYAQAAKTQTSTAQTQTDLIPQLPPLKLLPPLTSESVVSTQTPVQSVTPAPAPPHPSPRLTSDTPRPGATARPNAWQVARGHSKPKPTSTGRPGPPPSQSHSPTRGRSERQSRPAVKISPGRTRASHSVGRYPHGGGNFSSD